MIFHVLNIIFSLHPSINYIHITLGRFRQLCYMQKMLNNHFVLMFVDPCIIVQFIKKKFQQDATMYQNFIIPYLYKAQHVSGDTPPIIRILKLHWHPLVFHTWKVVGRVVGGRCQVQCA